MAISFNSVLDFNSTLLDKLNIGSRPFCGASMFKVNQFPSSGAFVSRRVINSRRLGLCLLSANSDRLITQTSEKGSRDSADNLRVQDEPRPQSSEASSESTLTSNQEETPSSVNLQEKPRKSSLTARERLRAARVLSRYNEAQAKTSKSEMGSKVLDAIKESERGKKKGLPEAPGNLFDDSNRGVSKPGLSFELPGEDRAAIASNSHSQAEKRRRDRINAQLSNLRKLIPKSDRMDKAALLGRAIEEVKDLKLKSLEVSKNSIVPTEMDEVTIESDIDGNLMTNTISKSRGNTYIKASLCCEDSPELFSELIKVLKGLKLKVVRAEVASVGGRTKNVLVLCYKDNEKSSICLNTIKHSLKLVLSRFASSSSSLTSNSRTRSKRQRFFLPSH